jgi:hypothetical protein
LNTEDESEEREGGSKPPQKANAEKKARKRKGVSEREAKARHQAGA